MRSSERAASGSDGKWSLHHNSFVCTRSIHNNGAFFFFLACKHTCVPPFPLHTPYPPFDPHIMRISRSAVVIVVVVVALVLAVLGVFCVCILIIKYAAASCGF